MTKRNDVCEYRELLFLSVFFRVHPWLSGGSSRRAAWSGRLAHRPRLRLEGHLEGGAFALQQADAAIEL